MLREGYFFYGDNFYEDKSNENLVLEFFSTTLFSARISEKKTAFFLQAFSSIHLVILSGVFSDCNLGVFSS